MTWQPLESWGGRGEQKPSSQQGGLLMPHKANPEENNSGLWSSAIHCYSTWEIAWVYRWLRFLSRVGMLQDQTHCFVILYELSCHLTSGMKSKRKIRSRRCRLRISTRSRMQRLLWWSSHLRIIPCFQWWSLSSTRIVIKLWKAWKWWDLQLPEVRLKYSDIK